MKKFARLYQRINLLSLDVAAGAMVSGLFFARIFDVHMLPWGFITLGLTVWIIYTADHLMDAKRLSTPASTERHRFHQRHFRELAFVLLVAALIDVVLISLIRKPVLKSGLVLGAAVAVYLLLQQNLKFLKELSGTVLYCSGVALPALSLAGFSITAYQGLLIVQFAITVLCNMLLFSLFGVREDLRDHHISFVTIMGEGKTRFVLTALFIINGLLTALLLFPFSNMIGPAIVLLVMNLVLLFIFISPELFEMDGLYRLLGDAVFLFPLFFLWI